MKILDRLPYHDRPTALSFGPRTIDVRAHQIIVWLSLRQRVFPAILDTGHSHNLTISSRQLAEWAGVDDREPIGEIEVNGRRMTQYRADLRLHRNQRGTRQPRPETFLLNVEEGITVMSDETHGAPRLPLLGLRPISRGGLKLVIDGKRREVTLRTPGWF
jgi:hypothetical protein